ncbi:hypothetical protein [Paenibacillus wynnii]|uniref:Lipoprotein n=1 Tax=Paenibacillus wynnii TaxID=268407 RepID=A0A098M7L1_9BACL|nr:hypothetical protein [Paenibacillus wynnii]KGE18023.1 hypothetical protein PWYN_26115 [Paenibacillus wynnii]
MSTKLILRGLLGLIILMSAGGCSTILDSKAEGSYTEAAANGPFLSFFAGDSEFNGSADKPLSGAYKKGITLRELLRNSGIVVFAEDGKSIISVTDVSLDPELKWELQVGEEPLDYEDWDHAVDRTDHIKLIAVPKGNIDSVESVVLFLNGASDHPEMTHSYVLPFIADSSVRSLLKNSELVQLSENNKSILTVNEYTPLTDEVWKVKVNGKLLMENGMDMKLRPQDEVEIVLNLR